ncbi:MAG: alpha/beta fold hydrolase [Spirochaetes bacterium]|nr:alpha/beta fold hydrolase [Spirochaetota bacterium]
MLAFDYYEGNPRLQVILLHGLFGSAKNMTALAQGITGEARVYAYDARNHGRSHHTATHNLAELTDDLADFISEHNIQNPVLIGHSMGGLTAMAFVRHHKDIKGLVVLDIAPRSYAPGHEEEIAAQKIDISTFASRKDIDEVMATVLPSKTMRQFLQMNITRDETGQYIWMNNVEAVEVSRSRTVFPPFENPLYEGPVLGVRGLKSDYVTDADVALMHGAFPRLEYHDFADAEHWLHHTHRDELLGLIRPFLRAL